MAEVRLRAMGCTAHLLVVGGNPGLAESGRARIEDLEARWSRFRPTSEVSLLNGLPGVPVVVSPETYELASKSIFGWASTGGAFDPTVLPALVAAGYDRSFRRSALDDDAPREAPGPAPGCGGITLDHHSLSITLPYGVTLDPGGIGKGLAGDIVARELIDAGAAGVMVDLGGDVRVAGTSPGGDGWAIGIADPLHPERDLATVRIAEGAVATSSTILRSWRRGSEAVNHLIDPSTGSPRLPDIVSVTVVGGAGWWAEVSTKHAIALGPTAAGAGLVNAAALFVAASGVATATPGFVGLAA